MLILSKIKVWLFTALGLLVGGLMIAVKILTGKNSRLTQKLETSEAKVHHAKTVAVKKKETAKKFNSRRAEAKSEIEETGVSKELENPNDNW